MILQASETETLARKILLHSRRRISQLCPALLESLYALPEQATALPGALSTDGRVLLFHPPSVISAFREDRDAVARQLLHVTVHCLLGHTELREQYSNPKAFDCTADLKAAQLAGGLCGETFALDPRHGRDAGSLADLPHLRPLYESLQQAGPKSRQSLRTAGAARFDDHARWTPPPAQSPLPVGGAAPNPIGGDGVPAPEEAAADGTPPDWDRIRRAMLEGFGGKLPGNCAGLLSETFAVEQRGMSFARFLRRFAAPEERLLMDPDSFDVRWYHLGLEYYGDLPLLEPSELSEPPLPDDLVVALDVSGSCHGETCRRFLKEILGILRDISAGAPRFRVLLLLCDTEIKREVLLETPEQVEALFADFTVTGFGGTDFRPVFERVEALRRSGALPRVRGLLYLTDGFGVYPDAPADYPTAFLIPAEDQWAQPRDAAWITRLYLNEHDFTLKEATAT